jgi:hypothetical protein
VTSCLYIELYLIEGNVIIYVLFLFLSQILNPASENAVATFERNTESNKCERCGGVGAKY